MKRQTVFLFELFYSVYSKKFNKNHLIKENLTPALQARAVDGRLHKRIYQSRASITVEAALAIPLFVFFIYLITLPLYMLSVHRQMQAVAETVAKHAAQYAYAKLTLLPLINPADEEVAGTSDEESEEILDMDFFTSVLESGALTAYAQVLADEKIADLRVEGVNALGTSFMFEDEMIHVKIRYAYKTPFSVLGVPNLKQSVQSSRRAWVGKDGIEGEEEASESEAEDMVYVGRTSTRFHRSATCHYLFNSLRSINYSALETQRNRSGGRYHACARCAGGVHSGTVYIMPSGNSYHATRDCSAIRAYVRTVPLSEVEHLGACSYCGGGH